MSERWLPRLNGVLDALESIRRRRRRTEAERTTASTRRLPLARGAPGALRLPGTGGGLGVAPLAGPGVRSTAQRGIIRGAALPDVARKWARARPSSPRPIRWTRPRGAGDWNSALSH